MPAGERTRPLRVAFVLEGLAFGGCPVNAVNLAVELRRRGHHVHLVAVDEDVRVSIQPLVAKAGLELEVVPRDVGLWGRAAQLRRVLDRRDLSVVHVFAPWLGRPAALAVGTDPTRAVVVLNWNMENQFPTTGRTPLVVGTRELRDEALERLPGGSVWLLEPPVDLAADRPDPDAGAAFRAAYGIAPDAPLLVLVGRVDRTMKLPGILRALRTVEELDDGRLQLAVVGDGDAMELVRRRAEEVNGALGRPAVVLTGSLDDPRPAYAAADVGLAMGGSALRALAHGTPLVVLGEGVFSKVFTPSTLEYFEVAGFYGHADPASEVDRLPEQVSQLLEDGERHLLGRFGREVVEERHGIQAAADLLEAAYGEALARRGSRLRLALDNGYLVARDWLGRARTRITETWRASHARPDHRPAPPGPTGTPGPTFERPRVPTPR